MAKRKCKYGKLKSPRGRKVCKSARGARARKSARKCRYGFKKGTRTCRKTRAVSKARRAKGKVKSCYAKLRAAGTPAKFALQQCKAKAA